MFKNAAKMAQQYRAGLMAETSYEHYYDAAIKALAEEIDQDAYLYWYQRARVLRMVAHLPTDGAKQAALRLIDAALGAKHPAEMSFAEYRKWRYANRSR